MDIDDRTISQKTYCVSNYKAKKLKEKALYCVEGQSGGKCLTFTLDNWFVILSRFEIVYLNVNSCAECDF